MDSGVDYAPGMRVLIRGEEWRVKKVEDNILGNKALYCVGISDLVRDREAVFLSDLDHIEPVNPENIHFVIDDSGHYRKSRLYIESQLRQKVITDKAIHIGDQAVMDPMPYQLEPAEMALGRLRQRILIADSVGLGKTLEAGILMSELIARGKGKRILVVTVKSMMTQFQKEMWDRFTIPLVRLDSSRIARIRASLPSNYNPFFYYDKVIVSIDTLKRDVEYRVHLENAYWDIIVIDEAQNVADRKNQAQRSKLAKLLARRSDSLILLSATPHDGRPSSFASLMNMLDPTAIANPEKYTTKDIQGLFIRRFKKDVKDQMAGAFLERKVSIEKAAASPAEEAAFDELDRMKLDMDESRKNQTAQGAGYLLKTGFLKSLFSSPAACLKSLDERLKKLYKRYPQGGMGDIAKLEQLKSYVERIGNQDFSKYRHLLSLLKSREYGWNPKAKDDRIVIFTERIETMKYVAAKLREDLDMTDEQVVTMAGTMSDEELQEKVDDFGRTESDVRILVASDVASEGLNLHYLCHRLIHFDIPWSLIVFQQRNGRIDRYGQKKQPDIRYMITESANSSIKDDNHIMEILIEKEQSAHENIGDPLSLMGKYNQEEEENVTAGVIERGAHEEDMESQFSTAEKSMSVLDLLLQNAQKEEKEPETKVTHDRTLMNDKEFMTGAMEIQNIPMEEPRGYSGIRIKMNDDDNDLKEHLAQLIPEEAMPRGDWLNLSDDISYCKNEMERSKENSITENSWSDTQYLWKLHPLMNWLNNKTGQLFRREEAPILGISKGLSEEEIIFIVEGSIPNRKSTPVVDEWFGVGFRNGSFRQFYGMDELINRTGLDKANLINAEKITQKDCEQAKSLLHETIGKAKEYLQKKYMEYKKEVDPQVDKEVNKLAELEDKHHQFYEVSLFSALERAEKIKETEKIFAELVNWVHDTLEIENNPYIRVIAVLKGVQQ